MSKPTKIVRKTIKNRYVYIAVGKKEYSIHSKTLLLGQDLWDEAIRWVERTWAERGEIKSGQQIEEALTAIGFKVNSTTSPSVMGLLHEYKESPATGYGLEPYLRLLSREKDPTLQWFVSEITHFIKCVAARDNKCVEELPKFIEGACTLLKLKVRFAVEFPKCGKTRLAVGVFSDISAEEEFVSAALALESLIAWLNAGCKPRLGICRGCSVVFTRQKTNRFYCQECHNKKRPIKKLK